jgi:hypothetical protein
VLLTEQGTAVRVADFALDGPQDLYCPRELLEHEGAAGHELAELFPEWATTHCVFTSPLYMSAEPDVPPEVRRAAPPGATSGSCSALQRPSQLLPLAPRTALS